MVRDLGNAKNCINFEEGGLCPTHSVAFFDNNGNFAKCAGAADLCQSYEKIRSDGTCEACPDYMT